MGVLSEHLYRVLRVLESKRGWLTAKEIAASANVAPRTARNHLLTLVLSGIVDEKRVFPGHRYKLRKSIPKAAKAYLTRIRSARDVVK